MKADVALVWVAILIYFGTQGVRVVRRVLEDERYAVLPRNFVLLVGVLVLTFVQCLVFGYPLLKIWETGGLPGVLAFLTILAALDLLLSLRRPTHD